MLRACAKQLCCSVRRQAMAKKSVINLSSRTSPSVRPFSSASEDLEKAKARLSVLPEDPGNDVKLKLYGLYKQVRRASLGFGWFSIMRQFL